MLFSQYTSLLDNQLFWLTFCFVLQFESLTILFLTKHFGMCGCRDVTYVTASGSIVAAAGYSSNGNNVVVWDTLAPSVTSQASIMCHEGLFL